MSTQPIYAQSAGERALKAAKALIAEIPRQQATPNMPRVAATGTLVGVHLDFPPTQTRRDNSLGTGNAVTPRVAQHLFERVVAALP